LAAELPPALEFAPATGEPEPPALEPLGGLPFEVAGRSGSDPAAVFVPAPPALDTCELEPEPLAEAVELDAAAGAAVDAAGWDDPGEPPWPSPPP
jgi:hypothetical protein